MNITAAVFSRVFLGCSPALPRSSACRRSGFYRMKTYAGPVSDHFDGLHFFDSRWLAAEIAW